MKRFPYILTAACLFLLLFNCKDENEEPVIPTKLEVDKTSLSVSASASSESFAVFSNKDWNISTESSWVTFSPASGKADLRITVEVNILENLENESRNAVVTVKVEDLTVQIEIHQSGKEIIIIDGIEIPDEKFRQFLLAHFDLNGDGAISMEEAEAVTFMDCSGKEIESLEGLAFFINLDTLICSGNFLTDMDISRNVLLEMLNCDDNSIQSLDISTNPEITFLSCQSNQLEALTLSNASKLIKLNCSSNILTTLELSDQSVLETLDCSYNDLSGLDLSNNTALTTLNCSGNQLTNLDVSANLKLEKLDCLNNEFLTKISLAEGQVIPELIYDSETTELEYPETPPDKEYINIPDAHFKAYLTANFDTDHDGEISEEEALEIKEIRSNRLGIVSMTGIESFPNLEVLFCAENNITSLNTTNNLKLKVLYCVENGISFLDLKSNTELVQLYCSDNYLTELNVSANEKLESLSCQKNNLKILDLCTNSLLNTLNCRDNPSLSAVVVEQGQRITYIYMDTPPTSLVYATYVEIKDEAFLAYLLEHFDTNNDQRISEMEIKNITVMDCSNLDIEFLDALSLFTNLTSLTCSGNKLTSLNLNSLTRLVTLVCDNNQLSQLNISQNTALVTLNCSHNELVTLGTSANKELKTLICNDNKLVTFELTANTKLETLLCQNNSLVRWIYLHNNLMLHTMDCRNNPQFQLIFLRENQEIENLQKDESVKIQYYGEQAGGIIIPDSKFRDYLIANFDRNDDDELSYDEALAARTIDCSGLGITSLAGIEYFTNLTTLKCSNNQLSSLPISELTALTVLDCSDNQLSSLELASLSKLSNLNCQKNQLTTLDVTHNPELTYLDCQNNKLLTLTVRRNPKLHTVIAYDNLVGFVVYRTSSQTSLNISISPNGAIEISDVTGVTITDPIFEDYLIRQFDTNGDGSIDPTEQAAIKVINCSGLNISSLSGINSFANLEELNCSDNKLTSLDLLGLANLKRLICSDNKLSALNLSNMPSLAVVMCHDNVLTSINVTNSLALEWLYCPGNLLTTLDVSSNEALTVLDCSENPRLSTVYLSLTYHSEGIVTKDEHTSLVFH